MVATSILVRISGKWIASIDPVQERTNCRAVNTYLEIRVFDKWMSTISGTRKQQATPKDNDSTSSIPGRINSFFMDGSFLQNQSSVYFGLCSHKAY